MNSVDKLHLELISDVKNKMEKLNQFNPETLLSMSDNSFNDCEEIKDEADISASKRRLDNTLTGNKRRTFLETYNSAKNKAAGTRNKASNIKLILKNFIRYIDIVTSIIVLFGCFLSQLENMNYYQVNLKFRLTAVELAKAITFNKTNFNNSYFVKQFGRDDYISDFNDFRTLKAEMVIDQYSSTLRNFILVTTLISSKFYFILVILLCISGYLEHKSEVIYKERKYIFFVGSGCFYNTLGHVLLVLPIQYPNINYYLLYFELGIPLCIPITSILSALSFCRIYFILILFKHFTKWTNPLCEYLW